VNLPGEILRIDVRNLDCTGDGTNYPCVASLRISSWPSCDRDTIHSRFQNDNGCDV